VRGGRDAPPELIGEFRRRYDIVGRSPLVDITLRQAAALQELLNTEHGAGAFVVRAGMLHSEPRVAAAIDDLVQRGARRVVGIVLAPQYSSIILKGYERAADAARAAHPRLDLRIAGAWHTLPEWINSLARRLSDAMAALPRSAKPAPVIFTAHSLPKSVVDRDPAYIGQLRDTATAVAEKVGLTPDRWRFAYQSAGHTPEPWLTPDVKDLLPSLRDAGVRTVLVAPVQFLTDHLEILYDIDVAAVNEAQDLGIAMRRIAMPNASGDLIAALAAVLRREMAASGVTAA
jgi:ferrochelatase